MGIPCDFHTYIYADSQSVLANLLKPFSVLKKKSCSITYHFVCEVVPRDNWQTGYISTHENPADFWKIIW